MADAFSSIRNEDILIMLKLLNYEVNYMTL